MINKILLNMQKNVKKSNNIICDACKISTNQKHEKTFEHSCILLNCEKFYTHVHILCNVCYNFHNNIKEEMEKFSKLCDELTESTSKKKARNNE